MARTEENTPGRGRRRATGQDRPGRFRQFAVLLFLLLITRQPHADGYDEYADAEYRDDACKPVISADRDWRVIIVRPHENALRVCTLTQAQLGGLVGDFLKKPETRKAHFTSISLGRLVDHPWLSKYLALQALASAKWDRDKGRPRSGHNNQLARELLSTPEITGQIQSFFAGSGYTVAGASVEKVLVTKANDIDWLGIQDPVLVPYDAITYFILKKPPP